MNIEQFLKENQIYEDLHKDNVMPLIKSFFKFKGMDLNSELISSDLVYPLSRSIKFWNNLINCEEPDIRDSKFDRGFHKVLFDATVYNIPINFLILLCPSYKRGLNALGIKVEPGQTTFVAFKNGIRIKENTEKIGIPCTLNAYFYDIAIENAEAYNSENWQELEMNILMDKMISKTLDIPYSVMSKDFEVLSEKIGRKGLLNSNIDELIDQLKINKDVLSNVIKKSVIFYKDHFGWDEQKSTIRAKEVGCVYSMESLELRRYYKNPAVIYSAYSYERSFLYAGPDLEAKIGIVYPKKPSGNSYLPTISEW